jgi:hypothetical protein
MQCLVLTAFSKSFYEQDGCNLTTPGEIITTKQVLDCVRVLHVPFPEYMHSCIVKTQKQQQTIYIACSCYCGNSVYQTYRTVLLCDKQQTPTGL